MNGIVNLSDFKENKVSLNNIYLDPNNPRFAKNIFISDDRITEDSIQRTCFEKMQRFDIEKLKKSIFKVGFMPIDKVVVRPIKGLDDKYVVVEGNRRITALKSLKIEHESGEIQLPEEILKSIINFEVYVYVGSETDIAWIIQGIRHISGVRAWKPYQKAQLLAKMVKEKQLKPEEIGKAVGIGTRSSANLLRSFHAYNQSLLDDEFGENVKPGHFSYFQEAIFTPSGIPMQNWLKWDEKEKKFSNIENLKKLLSWIVKTDDKTKLKIDRAIDLRDVVCRSMVKYPQLFNEFESSEDMHVDKLKYKIWTSEEEPKQIDRWLQKLTDIEYSLENLPDVKIKISDKSDEFITMLENIRKLVEEHKKAIRK